MKVAWFMAAALCSPIIPPLQAQVRAEAAQERIWAKRPVAERKVSAETPASRQQVAQAMELVEQGRWSEAIGHLRRALADCPDGQTGKSCRLLVNYSLGYCYQLQHDGDADLDRLRRAEAYYGRVLAAAPKHPATRSNLARLQIAVGDAEMASGNLDGALQAFRQSLDLKPDSEAARRRIVSAYGRADDERLEELFETLQSWREQFPEVSRRGYAVIVDRLWQTQPEMAEQALAAYAGVLAAEGWVSEKALAELPREWSPVADLSELIVNGNYSQDDWWKDHEPGLQARLALSLGKRWLAAGRSEATEDCWSSALEEAPRRGMGAAWIQLSADLAALYTNRPELDPEGAKFDHLQSRLFDRKGEAYRTDDLEAIQRLHTVLGLIYADRDQWESNWPSRNAIFQLSHAIDTATRRGSREQVPYQPQAQLKELLAKGYLETGDRRAHSQYLDAGRAYLDTDDLEKARQMISAAKATRGRGTSRDERQLERIFDARRRSVEDAAIFCPFAAHELALPRGDADGFLSRQRFKALTDCSEQVESAEESRRYANEALATAVERDITLLGAADMLRIDKLQTKLQTTGAQSSNLAPGRYNLTTSLGTARVAVEVPGPEQELSIYLDRTIEKNDGK